MISRSDYPSVRFLLLSWNEEIDVFFFKLRGMSSLMKSFCLASKQMRKRSSSYLHVSLVSSVIVVHSLRQRQHTSPILLSSTYLDTTNHIAQHDSGDKRNRIFNHDDTSPSSKAEYTDQKRKFLIALVSVSIIPFPSLPFPSLPVQSSSIVRSMRKKNKRVFRRVVQRVDTDTFSVSIKPINRF